MADLISVGVGCVVCFVLVRLAISLRLWLTELVLRRKRAFAHSNDFSRAFNEDGPGADL